MGVKVFEYPSNLLDPGPVGPNVDVLELADADMKHDVPAGQWPIAELSVVFRFTVRKGFYSSQPRDAGMAPHIA